MRGWMMRARRKRERRWSGSGRSSLPAGKNSNENPMRHNIEQARRRFDARSQGDEMTLFNTRSSLIYTTLESPLGILRSPLQYPTCARIFHGERAVVHKPCKRLKEHRKYCSLLLPLHKNALRHRTVPYRRRVTARCNRATT